MDRLADLLIEYGTWKGWRVAVLAREEVGEPVGDDLFKSDDAGIELLHRMAAAVAAHL